MDHFINLFNIAYSRLARNLSTSFTQLTAEKWIRMIAIVGGYILLRGWYMNWAKRAQVERWENEDRKEKTVAKAKMMANELHGFVEVPEDSEDNDEEKAGGGAEKTSGADWGKKARRRQRRQIKDLLEAQEKRLTESLAEQQDEDIEEFLVKD